MDYQDFETKYQFTRDGQTYLRLALTATIYWSTESSQSFKGMKALATEFWKMIQGETTFFQTTSMKKPKKLDKKSVSLVDEILQADMPPVYEILIVDDRTSANAAADKGFIFASAPQRGVGFLNLKLPPAFDVDAFQDLLLKGIAEVPFFSGFAGLGLVYNEFGELATAAKSHLYALGMKHVGLDLQSTSNTSYIANAGIKCVNWLNLIGAQLAERVEPIKSDSSDLVVTRLPTGLVIKAGPRPCIGDVNRQDVCPLYRQAASLLKSVVSQDHPAFIADEKLPMASEERTETWLARFND